VAHEALLKDPQVQRWYDNVSRTSELINSGSCQFLGNLPSSKILMADPQPA
jgi:hypothetical protein